MFFWGQYSHKKGSLTKKLPIYTESFSTKTRTSYFNSEKVANGQAVCSASFLSKTRKSYFNSEKYLIVRTICEV